MVLNPKGTTVESVKAVVTIILGLLILGTFIVLLGGHRFWEEYDDYLVRFGTVKDLAPGRPVKFSGLDVGKVLAISVDQDNPALVNVTIGVRKGFPLYVGTQATISQKGLVGDNYVLLTLQPPVGPRLDTGAQIPEEVSLSINDVAQRIGVLVDTLTPALTRATQGLERIFSPENTERITAMLQESQALLSEARTSVAAVRTELSGVVQAANQGIARGVGVLEQVGAKAGKTLDTADTAIRSASGDFSRTLDGIQQQIDTVAGELTRTLKELREAGVPALEQVGGLAGDVRDDWGYDQEQLLQVLGNLNTLLEDLRRLAQSLRERPWQIIYQGEGRAVP